MGIKGGDDRRPPRVGRPRHGAPDHGLMAEVEAVEIAKGDDGIAERFRHAGAGGKALHLGLGCRCKRKPPLVSR
ncbi:hypothetical protein GCM10022281_11920 [Sphingomonas rosea]|uniref:Uncharacterized protein n=1 Tax=Sphingomonas rosea TaxID=335605 RepID=A0ABP7TZJ4_9SPHN